MKLILERWNRFLNEEIKPYTNRAEVYHSFGIGSGSPTTIISADGLESPSHSFSKEELEDVVRSISVEGFKPGDGQMYGKGVYTTLESSHLRKEYGNFSLVFEVSNLDKFLILPYKEAKKVYLKNHTLLEQMEKNNIPITYRLDEICKLVDDENKRGARTTKTAEYAFALSGIKHVTENIRGLVFEGKTDGKVLVGYYPEDFSVIGYGEVHVSKTSNYSEFILDKKRFYNTVQSYYAVKDKRILPIKFFMDLEFILETGFRTVEDNMNYVINTYIPNLNPVPAMTLTEEELVRLGYDQKSIFYMDKTSPEYEELQEIAKEILFQEIKHFFERGYYNGMVRKFNLTDETYLKNLKKIE